MSQIVSVVMPVYNCERYLLESIDSVLKQTYSNLELVIVDDGSTDDSAGLIKKVIRQDERIVYIYQNNQGPGAARNRGIESARGEYIAFIDADDIWFHDKIEKQIEKLTKLENTIIFGGSRYIWENSNKTRVVNYKNFKKREEFFKYLAYLPSNKIAFTCAVICNKKCITKVGNFDTSLNNAEDWDLWLRLAIQYPFYALPSPVFYRRKHESNSTSHIPLEENVQNELKVLSKLREDFIREKIDYNNLISRKYRQYAGKAYLYKKYRLSKIYIKQAIKADPLSIFDKQFFRLLIKIIYKNLK